MFFSTTTEPNYTKLGWDGPWMVPFQICVGQPRPTFNTALLLKIEIFSQNEFKC